MNFLLNNIRSAPHTGQTSVVLLVICACFISSSLLGVFPILASAVLGLCACLTCALILMGAKLPAAGGFILLYYFYTASSAVVFGGGKALEFATLVDWFQGEGRIFLTFWPALLLMVSFEPQNGLVQRLDTVFVVLSALILGAIILRTGWDIRLFSSHHGAGSLAASVFLYLLFATRHRPTTALMVGLLCASLALLGSGSRTAVLACAIGVAVALAIMRDWRAVGFVFALAAALAVIMPILFEHHYDRLLRAGAAQTYVSMATNFYIASNSKPPAESQSAFAVRDIATTEGNANLAIRGFLWGRAWGEFAASPFFGIGFGRYNDGTRQFSEVLPGVRPVINARFNNPAQHTAHNSVFHILAELGLAGLLLLGAAARQVWTTFTQVRRTAQSREILFWADLGLATWVFLLASSMTQHALGAPIFGLSALVLLFASYTILALS